jgi:hypothetical protein
VLLDAAAEQIARRVVEELRQREATRDRLERDKRQKSRSPLDEHPEEKVARIDCSLTEDCSADRNEPGQPMAHGREGRFPVRRRVGIRREGEVRSGLPNGGQFKAGRDQILFMALVCRPGEL